MRIGNIRFNGGAVTAAIVITIVISIMMSGFIFVQSQTMSPEIYFHVEDDITTDVIVRIDGGVTKTIPEIPLGREVVWKDVKVTKDGAVNHDGMEYPFLYYEGIFTYPDSNYGWCLKLDGPDLHINGIRSDLEPLEFIEEEFLRSGLCEAEASFLLGRVIDNDMLETHTGYLVLRYIPMCDVDEVIHLSTSHGFSVIRRHFVIEEAPGLVVLAEPEFEPVVDNGFVIHETAVNRL